MTVDGDPALPGVRVLREGQRLEAAPASAIHAKLFLFLFLVIKYFLGMGACSGDGVIQNPRV